MGDRPGDDNLNGEDGDDNLNGLDGNDRLNGGDHDVRGDFCKNGEKFFGCEVEVVRGYRRKCDINEKLHKIW